MLPLSWIRTLPIECPKKENDRANYGETNEEMLLTAYLDEKKAEKKIRTFGFLTHSNHMYGKKELLYHIDEKFQRSVKLSDN